MITATNLDIHAPDGRCLLHGLTFHLREGHRVAFSGPNGCGKSTLLRYIAGLEPHSRQLARDISSLDIAYLPTRPLELLLPWGSVARNISFLLPRRVEPAIGSLAEFFENVDYSPGRHDRFLETEVYKLSSGQQAILAVYCALSKSPKLLVADEIFSTLSAPLRANVAKKLVKLEISIACSSHDGDFLQSLLATVIPLDSHITPDVQS